MVGRGLDEEAVEEQRQEIARREGCHRAAADKAKKIQVTLRWGISSSIPYPPSRRRRIFIVVIYFWHINHGCILFWCILLPAINSYPVSFISLRFFAQHASRAHFTVSFFFLVSGFQFYFSILYTYIFRPFPPFPPFFLPFNPFFRPFLNLLRLLFSCFFSVLFCFVYYLALRVLVLFSAISRNRGKRQITLSTTARRTRRPKKPWCKWVMPRGILEPNTLYYTDFSTAVVSLTIFYFNCYSKFVLSVLLVWWWVGFGVFVMWQLYWLLLYSCALWHDWCHCCMAWFSIVTLFFFCVMSGAVGVSIGIAVMWPVLIVYFILF